MNNLDQSIDRDNGLVDYCRLHDITLQAWSPFQAQFFDGPFIGNAKYAELNAVLDRIAAEKNVTPEAIATAWILRHPAHWQVVLGTTTPARVVAAAAGSGLSLSKPQWYELYRAAGHVVP
jgi:predicted oxidoreductase